MSYIGRILNYRVGGESADSIFETWEDGIVLKEEDQESGRKGLRTPQMGAIYSVLSHWQISAEPATVVMPTGTGKTEVMISLLLAAPCYKTMIVVPSDVLRSQISTKVQTLGLLSSEGFHLLKEGVKKPLVGIMKHGPRSSEEALRFIGNSNVIVTTVNILASLKQSVLEAVAGQCTHLFIDEAHHVPAATWTKVKVAFRSTRILQFTATPFRHDGRLLQDKIIFNYSLRKAQQDGYFKKINFLPIEEWNEDIADEKIAEKAVEQLKSDILAGFDHILMARVCSIDRAALIYEIYSSKYSEFNPVILHSKLSAKSISDAKRQINNGESKIVVCVDMFGEGFDFPQLKIAAFHDIKKSLPTTLQLVGRFTRTSNHKLGEASIVVNTANIDTREEISQLYACDADWNLLLPYLSEENIDAQISLHEFLQGFQHFPEELSIQNLSPALSAVVYRVNPAEWHPERYRRAIRGIDDSDKLYFDQNPDKNTAIIVAGRKDNISFGKIKDVYDLHWTLYVLYLNVHQGLLYVHCSDNGSLFSELAKAVTDTDAHIIDSNTIFKCLGRVNRIRVTNVGLKDPLSVLRSFTMHAGADVERVLIDVNQRNKEKSNIFVTGFENGQEVSIGCSKKGRVWSRKTANLSDYTQWCDSIGDKLLDPAISDQTVMKHTLKSQTIDNLPHVRPISIEWPTSFYSDAETRILIGPDSNLMISFYAVDLFLDETVPDGIVEFIVRSESFESKYRYEITDNGFNIINISNPLSIQVQGKTYSLSEYLVEGEHNLTIRYVNGDFLEGVTLIKYDNEDQLFPKDDIYVYNWIENGVNIRLESQDEDKNPESIQYCLIQLLKSRDYDIIYDDDGAGEIADVVALKVDDEHKKVRITLFHIKYSKGSLPGARIDDLYVVNGQAQKCVKWLRLNSSTIIQQMLTRGAKPGKNRYESGTEEELSLIRRKLQNMYEAEYSVYVVQPGLSRQKASIPILTLLNLTKKYLWDTRMIRFGVIASE